MVSRFPGVTFTVFSAAAVRQAACCGLGAVPGAEGRSSFFSSRADAADGRYHILRAYRRLYFCTDKLLSLSGTMGKLNEHRAAASRLSPVILMAGNVTLSALSGNEHKACPSKEYTVLKISRL